MPRVSNHVPDERGLILMECNCGRRAERVPVKWVGRYGWTCSDTCKRKATR